MLYELPDQNQAPHHDQTKINGFGFSDHGKSLTRRPGARSLFWRDGFWKFFLRHAVDEFVQLLLVESFGQEFEILFLARGDAGELGSLGHNMWRQKNHQFGLRVLTHPAPKKQTQPWNVTEERD